MTNDGITARLTSLASATRELAELLAHHPDRVADTLRLLRRKLPTLRRGLQIISKSDKSEVLSIGTYLERNARERPDAPALLYLDRRYTHRELHELSNRYANALANLGIGKGDAVAIFVENRPEMLLAVAGAVKLGAIAAVINTNQRKKVLAHSFSLCNAKAYVIGAELYDAFAEVRAPLPHATADRVMWIPEDDRCDAPRDAIDARDALDRAPATTPAAMARVTLGDPCFYIYTSGTTGLPKASIMSHFRWVKASAAFGLLALDMRPTDVMYVPLPFYHNNALTVGWSSAAVSGAALVMRRKFSASKFWDDVRHYHATCFCYIGELCRYLMNQPARPDDADNPVTKIVGNGLRPDIWKAFKRRFGIDEVYEFYAASEGNIAFVNAFNLDCTVGFCPAPYAIVEYDVDRDEPVRGPDGFLRRVPRGGVGLLIGEVTDKYAFDGYTDPEASEKKLLRNAFRQGDVWFNSGDLLRDLGFRHAQFVDRVGDTFRWKSENVSTNEVAEVINQFPQVDEATVYGVEIPRCEGRAGMAAIVANVPVDEFDFAGFVRHMHEQLPPYAIPVFLRFRPALDTTSTFKQKKGDLKNQGYDPAQTGEPTFVMLPKTNAYVRVTPDIFKNIQAGEYPF
ncbi:MAG: long-chain-acyl-CoA synthetase [Deltaproteobacteria bacterium]|nr:MAG: long-chain-acyl-CoA synthetase [Deltaproteobacteria bacterium]